MKQEERLFLEIAFATKWIVEFFKLKKIKMDHIQDEISSEEKENLFLAACKYIDKFGEFFLK